MSSEIESFFDALTIQGRSYTWEDQMNARLRLNAASNTDFLDLKAQVNHSPLIVSNLTANPSIAEVGATINSITFNWNRNLPAATQSFNNGIGSISPSVTSLIQPVSLNSDTTFILTATDGTTYPGNTSSAS